MSYRPHIDASEPNLRILPLLWSYVWPAQRWDLRVRAILAILCMLLSKIAAVCIPMAFKMSVDALDTKGSELLVAPLGIIIAYGAIRLSQVFFDELKSFLFTSVTYNAMHAVDLKVFEHLHQLSLRFHLSRKTGFLSRAVQRGVKAIETVLRFSTFNIIPTILEITFVGVILFVLFDPLFPLLTLLSLLLYVVFTVKVTQWRTHLLRQFNQASDSASNRAIDSLLNYETVKYFSNEAYEKKHLNHYLSQMKFCGIKNMESLSYLNFGQQAIISLGVTAVMILAAQGVQSKTMTLGDFVLVNTYMIQLSLPLGFLGFAYREIKMALVDMEQMFALLDLKPEIQDKPSATELVAKGGHLRFENVSFSYETERRILKNISFEVPAGKTVALVGRSGAGKSTIARLLFRFYDVTEGCITIDGQNIQDITQHSLRSSIGVVPQDTVLFNDTIAYNIAYGAPDAPLEEIIQAAKLAQIHGFIDSLPQKYNTMVGERGLKLSGGEKQRVAIARVLLKKPAIFLFDEATSALDSRTEADIQKSLDEVSTHRTTLVIAHRLSTVVNADEILVLEDGQIVEQGTHEALLAQGGLYRAMWLRQQEESHTL